MTTPVQLPLQFEFQTNQSFSTYYPGENQEIISHLKQLFNTMEQQVFLWGDTSSGKTHLLQATCQIAKQHQKSCFYYSLKADNLPDPLILESLENIDLVCFDNIDQIANNSTWEQAFFNFFNLHRDNNKQLILSALCPPKFMDIQLADLKTRMGWGLTLKLKPLTDEQQLNALIYKANDLGFEIPPKVGRFLISRYAKDTSSIWTLLGTIDHATLAAKRKLTIPFLKQIMTEQESHESR